jgi:hypothetical protein
MTRWKAERRLGVYLLAAGDGGRVLVDEGKQLLAQAFNVCGTGAEDFGGRWIIEERQKQVLDGYEFVPLLPRLHEGHVQADFKFLGNHQFSSITHASGCWCLREYSLTC